MRRLVSSGLSRGVASAEVTRTLSRLGVSTGIFSASESLDRWAFFGCPLSRPGQDARRLVFVGELAPECGAAEFLACAITLADSDPKLRIEITWLGEGDLLGVLQAQPTPSNLSQSFGRVPSSDRLAAIFARSGLFVVPGLLPFAANRIAEAMASGLLVIGNRRDAKVRLLVEQNETGWLFDPRSESQTLAALAAGLNTPTAQLDQMRHAARARIRVLHQELFGEPGNRAKPDQFTPSLADNAPA
jgi:glycosyltransferase involved in cell wall biosynthesis